MLTKKTALVLGAGASAPFGFPIGTTLSEHLVDGLESERAAFNWLSDCGFVAKDIEAFREAFRYSGKDSVDAFLEHHPELVPIGKAAIAVLLIGVERPERVFAFQNNWLRALYAYLNAGFEEFGDNRIAFITFNYDRTVEFFLHQAFMNTYGKSEEEAWRSLQKIPIIHLHGRMGCLPGQNGKSRAFAPDLGANSIITSAEGIKIIHEDIDASRDADFVAARKLLQEADQIIFMGFGYNQKNMERLGLAEMPVGKAQGSRVGIGFQELQRIKRDCGNRINFVDGDCTEIVRERIIWE